MLFRKKAAAILAGVLAVSAIGITGAAAAEKEEISMQFMDCFEPMPIIGSLSDSCWGAEIVGPRDLDNGLEDREMKDYSYWDGGIIKDDTGKYYMFASRWEQKNGFDGWLDSQAVYAVSDNLYGPYEDQGPIWSDWCDGAGHNVFPFELSESDPLYGEGYRYAISISDTGRHGNVANGTIHISKSLDGPWDLMENGNSGKLNTKGGSGFSLSNVSIMVRPDGRYEAANRDGDIAVADSVAGVWEVVRNKLWNSVSIPSDCIEDPVIWYSDGLYHIVANKWDTRRAYYLTSTDGINDWRVREGTAYMPNTDFLKYEDGTVNRWSKIERPNIYVENGEITAMTFAVIDSQKEDDHSNDRHGSKVIVVPFSSEKLKDIDAQPDLIGGRDGIIAIEDTTAQALTEEERKNYGAEYWIQLQRDDKWRKLGMGTLGEGDSPSDRNSYDSKIAFIKFDISEILASDSTAPGRVYLSLILKEQVMGSVPVTRIQVALSDTEWTEGLGRDDLAKAGELSWKNRPGINDDTEDMIAESDSFDPGANEKEIKIDVTKLVERFIEEYPDEKVISFALNIKTSGSRLRIMSRETGERTAPKLILTNDIPKEPVTDTDKIISNKDDGSKFPILIVGIIGGAVVVAVIACVLIRLSRRKDKSDDGRPKSDDGRPKSDDDRPKSDDGPTEIWRRPDQ